MKTISLNFLITALILNGSVSFADNSRKYAEIYNCKQTENGPFLLKILKNTKKPAISIKKLGDYRLIIEMDGQEIVNEEAVHFDKNESGDPVNAFATDLNISKALHIVNISLIEKSNWVDDREGQKAESFFDCNSVAYGSL